MTMATLSTGQGADRLATAEQRMYDGEVALHDAWQSGVDVWIAAAYEKLHKAISEHTAALRDCTAR